MAEKPSSDDFRIENIYTLQLQQKDLYTSFCPTEEPFQVYIAEEAFRDIYQHAMMGYKQGKGEIAGALIGNVYITPNQNVKFVEINASEPARTKSSTASVEIPKEEWHRISEKVESDPRYRLRSTIVGWYHSHPGFGVFMSGTDRNTQQSHFNLDWQVAIVIDPVKKQVGTFYGPNIKECPLYKLPHLEIDKSLMTASELLDRIIKGNVSDKYAVPLPDNSVQQQLSDIRNQIEDVRENQGNLTGILASIQSALSKRVTQIEETTSTKLQTQLYEIKKQIENIQDIQSEFITLMQNSLGKGKAEVIQANDQEIMGMIQGVEGAIDSLSKRVANQIDQSQGATSRELRETQSILDQIKQSFDLVKVYQTSIEQLSTNFQNLLAVSLKQFQESLRENLNVLSVEIGLVKEKLNDLQQAQKKQSESVISKADVISVKIDNLSEEVASSALAERLWSDLKYRLTGIAIVIFLLAFLGGIIGTTWTINRYFGSELSLALMGQMTKTPFVTNTFIASDLPTSTPDVKQSTDITSTPIAALTLTPSPTPTNTLTIAPNEGRIKSSQVNIRLGPGTEYERVGVTIFGDMVEVVAKSESEEWYQIVTANGIVGWISANYVELSNTDEIDIPIVTLTATPLSTSTP